MAAVAVSPDGWYILSGGLDHTVRYWSIDGAKLLWKAEAAHGGSVFGVAISPDGKLGVSGSGDRHLRIWDLKTGKEQPRHFVHPNAIRAVAFTPDGGHVVSGCLDGVIRVWSLETGGLVRSFYGHEELARAVAVSPDGALALSGGLDRHAYLWSMSHLGAHPPRTRAEERTQAKKASGGKSARADLQVSVRWNTGCDVDLHVFEPNAQECSWRNVRTLNGGVFSKEARSEPGFGPEEYQIVNAVPGEYLIREDLLKSANGASPQPTDAAVEVRRNAGGGRQQTERFNVRLESAGHYSRVCSVRFGEEGCSIQPILSSNASLDIDLPPSAGSVSLKSGFLPDPSTTQLEAGGIIQSKRGGIAAWVNRAPHFKLQYRAGKYALSFYVKSRADTMLLVNLPDGTWVADDDSGGGSNPLLRLGGRNPAATTSTSAPTRRTRRRPRCTLPSGSKRLCARPRTADVGARKMPGSVVITGPLCKEGKFANEIARFANSDLDLSS